MSVFPRPRSLPIAIISLLSVVVAVRADMPATPAAHQSEPFRQGVLVDTFGQWEIRKGLIDHTFLLIGAGKGDGEGHFWLHCDQNNMITVAVPLLERPHDRVRSHPVTIRADTGLTRAMSLVVFEDFVAVAIDYDGGRNDKVADFLDVLRSSQGDGHDLLFRPQFRLRRHAIACGAGPLSGIVQSARASLSIATLGLVFVQAPWRGFIWLRFSCWGRSRILDRHCLRLPTLTIHGAQAGAAGPAR
jgi:hypothetical protein